MAIDPTTTTTVRVGELPEAAFNTGDLIPHEVGGFLKKGNLQDLATFIGSIIDVDGAIGFRAVQVTDGQTLPATDEQEFILVGPGTYPNVGGGPTVTTTGSLNALVSNGTFWFIGVEIPITVNGIWGEIEGVLSDQTDLNDILVAKADLVDGKVPNSQLPSYVDDVVEVADYASLPGTGETGKIYITIDSGFVYRWSGSAYIRIVDEAAAWGTITGTLSNQTDLQNALNTKATDSNVVHLTGSEVITGVKTFNANVAFTGPATFFDSSTGILLKQVGFANYNKIQAIDGGFQFLENVGTSFYFNIQQSSIAFGLNTRRVTFNNSNLTSDRFYDLPNAGGTIALTYQLHDAVTIGTANGLSLSGQALSLALSSNSTTGALSSTDWNTFNGKQNALTNPITGTGTTNYLPKFTGASSLGNSQIYDNGTNVGIGTNLPSTKFHIQDTNGGIFFSGSGATYNRFKSTSLSVLVGKDLLFSAQDSGTTPDLYIKSSGNVGIGTVSPSAKLDVTDTSSGAIVNNITVQNASNTASTEAGIFFAPTTATGNIRGARITGIQENGSNTIGLKFYTGVGATISERMRITSGGNVLIGTTTDVFAKLNVAGSGKVASFGSIGSGNDNYISFVGTSNTFDVGITAGSWGIADSGVAYIFKVSQSGNVYVSSLGTGLLYSNAGTLTSTNPSDERLKDNIVSLNYGLNEILKLRPVSYNWKNDNINQGKQFGFIAQEVQEVMPELVKEFETEDGERLGLDKEGIYAALVNAIKELKAEIEILKNK